MAGAGKKPVTPAEIEKIAEELREKAKELSTVALAIKKKKLPHTDAMGKTLVRGQAYDRIDNFIRSCKKGAGLI